MGLMTSAWARPPGPRFLLSAGRTGRECSMFFASHIRPIASEKLIADPASERPALVFRKPRGRHSPFICMVLEYFLRELRASIEHRDVHGNRGHQPGEVLCCHVGTVHAQNIAAERSHAGLRSDVGPTSPVCGKPSRGVVLLSQAAQSHQN